MSTPILATKLNIPQPQPGAVSRPHLVALLEQGLHSKLTLVSAPAGSGKTTLVAEWIASSQRPAAWLSLDEKDSDSARFLTYFVAGLQTIHPEIGKGTVSLLQSPQPPLVEPLLTGLLNEIAAISSDFVFVLDDYHVLDNQIVDSALVFLLENLPPQMHLIITTREDPRLPLPRLRARRQLTEIRAANLRFAVDEIAELFAHGSGVNLSSDDIAALEARTEGWIAGLQLAAISMQGQEDTSQFIESFTGSHHFVLDYLVEEVLKHQPEHIQDFLLKTSILDQMCGSLCEAVLQMEDYSAQTILENIQRANLFLIPLDHERRWYRYHHLFGDLLRKYLRQASEIDQSLLHIRASEWYEANGFEIEAFEHAAAANDLERAERLVERDGTPLYLRGGAVPVLQWFATLPSAVLETNPSLLVTYATITTVMGQQIDRIEEKLQAAEAVLQTAELTDENRDLIGRIAAIRGMLAGPRQEIEAMLAQSSRALEFLQPTSRSMLALATWTQGLAYQQLGERQIARQVFAETVTLGQSTKNTMVTIAALTCLGQLQEVDNQLYIAQQSYQRVLNLIGEPPWPSACESYLGLARLHYQWNRLDQAAQFAQQGFELGQQIENVYTPIECLLLLSRIQLAKDDLDGAASYLAESEQFAENNHFVSTIPRIHAQKVYLLLRQENFSAAEQITASHETSLVKVRFGLAKEEYAAVLPILRTARKSAEERQLQDERLEILLLQALAHAGLGEMDIARQHLDEALALAAPGGFVRIFLDEGSPMQKLVADAVARGVFPEYTNEVLGAFAIDQHTAQTASNQPLIEPLSDRELEVLSLIAEGLSNREIGERLFLALDTIKGHNRRIFAKLQVQRRTEAVSRARALGLL